MLINQVVLTNAYIHCFGIYPWYSYTTYFRIVACSAGRNYYAANSGVCSEIRSVTQPDAATFYRYHFNIDEAYSSGSIGSGMILSPYSCSSSNRYCCDEVMSVRFANSLIRTK